MLKNRYIKWTLKLFSALISFSLVWFGIQPFFVPKYMRDSTTIVKGFSFLEKNSIDVLFLGASQMFCSVDAGRLNDVHHISSYDYGASSQPLVTTSCYFVNALQTQKPKLIMVEICEIFKSNNEFSDPDFAWNYNPLPPSLLKFQSAIEVMNGDCIKAFEYSFIPLLLYHDRWSSINDSRHGGQHDIDFVCQPEKCIDVSTRGFLPRNHVKKIDIAFYNKEYTIKDIPKENVESIKRIEEKCKCNNIELVFFKAPVSNWTKGDSLSVKQFMEENELKFVDLNDYLKEIGIKGETDFYDEEHLNTNGSKKTTDYLAKILHSYLQDN